MLPRALCGSVMAMSGRKARPTAERLMVVQAARDLGGSALAGAKEPLARRIAAKVCDELRLFLDEDDEPLLRQLSQLVPPSPCRALATDPEIDTLALYVEGRVANLRARSGRSLSPRDDISETAEVMHQIEIRLFNRYLKHLRG